MLHYNNHHHHHHSVAVSCYSKYHINGQYLLLAHLQEAELTMYNIYTLVTLHIMMSFLILKAVHPLWFKAWLIAFGIISRQIGYHGIYRWHVILYNSFCISILSLQILMGIVVNNWSLLLYIYTKSPVIPPLICSYLPNLISTRPEVLQCKKW